MVKWLISLPISFKKVTASATVEKLLLQRPRIIISTNCGFISNPKETSVLINQVLAHKSAGAIICSLAALVNKKSHGLYLDISLCTHLIHLYS